MYDGTLEHGRIIEAFARNVPGTYVRDYRDNMGYITVCRGYKDIAWGDQISTRPTYRQIPAVTMVSLPRGNVRAADRYAGVRLDRPGWRSQFRKAMRKLTPEQMRGITRFLKVGEVFPGIS